MVAWDIDVAASGKSVKAVRHQFFDSFIGRRVQVLGKVFDDRIVDVDPELVDLLPDLEGRTGVDILGREGVVEIPGLSTHSFTPFVIELACPEPRQLYLDRVRDTLRSVPPTAVDLFAGAGGATQGLRDAGFDIVAAVENELDAATTWQLNHPGRMFCEDVRQVTSTAILAAGGLQPGELDLLKACPPCQGFSSLRGGASVNERQNDLVVDTLRFVAQLAPRAVLLENVPGLRRDGRFDTLTAGMRHLGYALTDYVVEASKLGVPQRRRRLVVLAVRDASDPPPLDDLVPPHVRRRSMTAGEALASLERQRRAKDPVHIWRTASGIVAERIAAVPVGGTRFDLPAYLQLDCHTRIRTKAGVVEHSATGSYGRVRLGEPAPTMTTRCTTPACGSFIHPVEHRGLSLREAAAFQTFPPDYRWHGSYGSMEKQIGNAVPVWMAETFGRAVLRLLAAHQ